MGSIDAALSRLIDQVRGAQDNRTGLEIRGAGSKRFYGETPSGESLDVTPLRGISSYEPSELVVTARAGTPLLELEAALKASGQCLPFEPPRFDAGGTVGGMVAAGLAGPARASAGSVRDHVLGITLLNGNAEVLSFGGQVAKNVAGYDVSRLMVGALGILGVICEVSLKVLPTPKASETLRFQIDELKTLSRFAAWASRPLPINASVWHRNELYVRLCGANAAVEEACTELGGERLGVDAAEEWWQSIRDQRHAFFAPQQRGNLWRVSLPARQSPLQFPGEQLIEWQGALRWWRTEASVGEVRQTAARAGGHATLWRREGGGRDVFTPLEKGLMSIHRNLKAAFDPHGLFNRGRLYADL
jgi:glycolate oxidase FAD binding subunit